MKCLICKTGETKRGTTTVTLERDNTVVVSKGVPARVCDNCGEYYLSEDVSTRIYALAEEAVKRKVEAALEPCLKSIFGTVPPSTVTASGLMISTLP